jgi:hypothetical protein
MQEKRTAPPPPPPGGGCCYMGDPEIAQRAEAMTKFIGFFCNFLKMQSAWQARPRRTDRGGAGGGGLSRFSRLENRDSATVVFCRPPTLLHRSVYACAPPVMREVRGAEFVERAIGRGGEGGLTAAIGVFPRIPG